FWSRVCDGSRWLEGARAVEFILALQGDSPALIPAASPVSDKPSARTPAPARAQVRAVVRRPNADLAGHIGEFLKALPTGLGGGHDRPPKCAAFRGGHRPRGDPEPPPGLAEGAALQAVSKGQPRLRETPANARQYGTSPVGCGLAPRRAKSAHHHPKVILRSRVEAS